MPGAGLRILVVGGRVEDVRAVDAGVRTLGLAVDWVEPADSTDHLDTGDLLFVVVDLSNTGMAVGRVFRDHPATKHTPLFFLSDVDTPSELRTKAYSFTPSECLPRPVAPEVVRARAGLVLDLRRELVRLPASELVATRREGDGHIATLGDNLPDVAIYQIVQHPEGDRRFTYVSTGIERILGIKQAEVMADANSVYGLILPEDLPRVLAAETEATRSQTVFDCQFRQLTRAGDIRWVRYRSAPRPVGSATVWDGSITDVTAEQRATEALRERERRFRLMVDSAPVLIWLAGTDKKCTWLNKPWLEFTARTLEQEQGDGWITGLHPDDREKCVRTYTRAFDARRPFVEEYRLRRHDGVFRWVLSHGIPIAGPDGEFAGYIGSAIDITDRKEMEEALRAADRRREDYLAMLAHELRNPLAPIRTGLHILGRRPDDANLVSETRDMMNRQVENMARIVDDLLDVSRVARGKATLRKSRLDLTDVARTCAEDRRAVAEGNGLKMWFLAASGPVWVDGDVTRLSQVLDNLIHNAVKFSSKGGTVTVSVTAEGDEAVARIRDSGIGIDAAMLPYLFEVFTQADRSLARSKGGLGLGLALVKGLVELHGGAVEARSEGPGQGSEFTVRLPRAAEPAALTEIPVSPSSVGKRKRILVIEDNRDSAESLRMLLDLSGYEVEVAYTGTTGVEAAARFRPHAVVCDIGLPELDGYGVARALRQRPDLAGARLIAVTGYGRSEDIEKARRAGFNFHLTKPVDPQELLEQLVFTR
jgi:PAS domain S-box-containing protein